MGLRKCLPVFTISLDIMLVKKEELFNDPA